MARRKQFYLFIHIHFILRSFPDSFVVTVIDKKVKEVEIRLNYTTLYRIWQHTSRDRPSSKEEFQSALWQGQKRFNAKTKTQSTRANRSKKPKSPIAQYPSLNKFILTLKSHSLIAMAQKFKKVYIRTRICCVNTVEKSQITQPKALLQRKLQ